MTNWIETAKELPPCDGFYETVGNYEGPLPDRPVKFKYDGFGFVLGGSYLYRHPKYWRHCEQPKKMYGKGNNAV